MVHHSDPAHHDVGEDHVGVKVQGTWSTCSCQPMPWCSPLFRIDNLAFRVPLNSLDGEEEENLQFLDLLPQVKR